MRVKPLAATLRNKINVARGWRAPGGNWTHPQTADPLGLTPQELWQQVNLRPIITTH
jgi:hypothetical protein